MSSAEITIRVVTNHVEDDSYMLEEYNVDDLQDGNCQSIACANATISTIYLQDGQYLVSADDPTILLESSNEDVNQYVLNDEVKMKVDINNPQVLGNVGMVRYYDEESRQIYYCKTVNEGDSNYNTVTSENNGIVLADNEIVINSEHDLVENESIKLEQPQFTINDDNSVDTVDQNMVELPLENEPIACVNERTKYSYAILKDGKLHLRTMEPLSSDVQLRTEQDDRIAAQLEALQQSISFDNPGVVCDLGSITGKNLITGQVVTLDSYLERLEKRKGTIQEELLRSPVKRQSGNYNISDRDENSTKYKRIINKNAVSDKLRIGRKLKGKIVKIEKKQSTTEFKKVQNAPDNSEQTIKKQNKEKNENSNCSPTTSYTLTKMQTLLVLKNAKEKVSSTLVGLMDLDSIRDQLKDKNIVIQLIEKTYDCSKKGYNKAMAYFYGRMMVKENKEGKRWELVLINNKATEVTWMNNNVSNGSEPLNKSDICQQPTVCVHLLVTTDKHSKKTTRVNIEHIPSSHCPFCNKTIETSLQVHLCQVHVPETTIGFVCSQCELNFDSMTRLQKHLRIHSRSYRFECGTCSKKFTRHTNWQRHMDVHKSASEVAYHCDICGCGFNYASSLTRHIVQKHISKR
ncbi:zinc finger protein 37 homolog isoform X2 [Agrilus planipennis]|uniref:Zinc finger protein 37 homolog isoform X2 n=1 Tax=Agrilus planipennis TaxID=224129 RepID=A0A1W4XP78_AGRPL|nr:zinc finger protein 37 homolog isoform X2 [Agrilus planipennis]